MVGSDSTRTELIDVEFPDPEQLCVFVKTGMLHDDDETALGIKSETAGLKRARGVDVPVSIVATPFMVC